MKWSIKVFLKLVRLHILFSTTTLLCWTPFKSVQTFYTLFRCRIRHSAFNTLFSVQNHHFEHFFWVSHNTLLSVVWHFGKECNSTPFLGVVLDTVLQHPFWCCTTPRKFSVHSKYSALNGGYRGAKTGIFMKSKAVTTLKWAQ